jgi:Na+/H+-dicarboxylate symporter
MRLVVSHRYLLKLLRTSTVHQVKIAIEREANIAPRNQVLDECTTRSDLSGKATLSSVLASRGVPSLTFHLLSDDSGV